MNRRGAVLFQYSQTLIDSLPVWCRLTARWGRSPTCRRLLAGVRESVDFGVLVAGRSKFVKHVSAKRFPPLSKTPAARSQGVRPLARMDR
jgi:hypothetical protein